MTRSEDGTIHVLHVEGDRSVAGIVRHHLALEGMAVTTMPSREDGLAYIELNGVDCVVSDHSPAGIDGLAFLEAVRKDYPDLPFVLFTGMPRPRVIDEAEDLDATDCIGKATPGEYSRLVDCIREAVR